MNRAQSGLVFLAARVVGGLALAFLIVAFWPGLLPGFGGQAAGAAGAGTPLPRRAATASGASNSRGGGTAAAGRRGQPRWRPGSIGRARFPGR